MNKNALFKGSYLKEGRDNVNSPQQMEEENSEDEWTPTKPRSKSAKRTPNIKREEKKKPEPSSDHPLGHLVSVFSIFYILIYNRQFILKYFQIKPIFPRFVRNTLKL